MFRTIIADDDFLVRSYLKQLNAWDKAGYEIVGDVRDGEEALQLVKEQSPDVLIADISMPLMDGIQLIREVREFNQDIYIIILSCHDDFNYVKEAMRLGANEYVLKNSLEEDTLYEILKNAEHQMSVQKKKSDEEQRNQKLIQMGSHSLKFHFFNQVLAGSMSPEEKENKRKEAGIQGRFVNSAVINIFIVNWYEVKERLSPLEMEQYQRLFLHKLSEQLELLLGDESRLIEVIYLGEGVICGFLDLSSMYRSSLMKQKLTSVASACFRCCREEPYSYTIGVSNICIGEDGIRQAYQQAREMMKLSFYEQNDILYFDSMKTIGETLPLSAQELLSYIKEYIRGRKKEELEKIFERVAADCKRERTEPKLIVHWIKELDHKIGFERRQEDYGKFIDIEQLKDVCREYCQQFFFNRERDIPAGVNSQVKQAVSYILEHFKDPIGLNEVAEAVGLNPAYLSYLFKQEMQIGFSNYLLDCRMDCAKALLKNTTYKIKDVALESGFNDYHYFSKAFKKLNGCSPAEYRKND